MRRSYFLPWIPVTLLQITFTGCGQDIAPTSVSPTSEAVVTREKPDNRSAWEIDVKRLSNDGDYEGIIAICDRVLTDEPKNVAALVWRAYGHMDAGTMEACLADINAALAIEPKHADAWVAKGDAHLRTAQTEYRVARQFYEQAIAIDEQCENAWRSRARSFAAEGAFQQAVSDYTAAIAQTGEHHDYFERGAAYQSLEQHETAILDFDAAIQLKPDQPVYYGRRSISWSRLKQFDKAVADAGKAIELDPQYPSGYRHRAAYHVRQGKLDLAIDDWLTAIERTADDVGAEYKPLSDTPPSDEALQHGADQLMAILRDRPEMARFCKPGDRLWNWAVHKLAGEDVGEPVYWNPHPLKYHGARHSSPQQQSVGWIQISPDPQVRNDGEGTAFEHLWACLVFELHNMTFAKEFAAVLESLEQGKFQQQEYVLAVAKIERRAKQQQSAFYAHVFLPWAREAGFQQSEPSYWLVSIPDLDREPERLLQGGSHYVTGYSDNYTVVLARLDCEKGKYKEARACLEALLARGPVLEDDELSQAYFWLGCSQLGTNAEVASLDSFKQAVALNDQFAGAYFAPATARALFGKPLVGDTAQTAAAYFCRGCVWLGKDELPSALADLNKAIELDSDYVAAFVQRAQVRYAREEYDQCLADVQVALRIEPMHLSALLLRGHVWAVKEEPTKALADYSEYIRRLPGRATGWLARGCLLRAQGDYEGALSDLAEVIRIEPAKPEHFLERARLYCVREEFDECIADLNQALAIRPDDGAALELRGLVWADNGKPEKAIQDLNEAVRLRPDVPEPRVARGHVYAKNGEQEKSLVDFNTALEFNPRHTEARIARAQLKSSQGDYDACIADLDKALEMDFAATHVYLLRGNAWMMKRDKEKALADLDEYVRRNSGSAESLCARGEVRLFLDDDDGMADLNSAIAIDPNEAAPYVARGKARHFRGEFREAITDFDHAVSLAPEYVPAYLGRADVWRDMKEFRQALADIDQAMQLSPVTSGLLCSRGEINCELRELDKALADVEAAIRLNPAFPWCFVIRGDVAQARENYAAALTDYDRAIDLSSMEAHPYVRRAKLLSECPDPQLRNTARAIHDATRACELTGWKSATFLSTLAGCHAEAGNFGQAIEWQIKALEAAHGDWKTEHVAALELFRSRKTLLQGTEAKMTPSADR